MIKILGVADIICAAIILLLAFRIEVPWVLVFGAGAYLLLKVLIFVFSFNIGSAIDIFALFFLFISLFLVVPPIFFFIAAALLVQKGLFSLV
jgi:hypothetical protein